jgi:DNA-binding LytR/AlgR family response regulator
VLKDKSYLALLPMRQIEKLLPAATFYRVHRSYIVSLEYVCGFDHDHVYFEKGCVPISAQYRTQLMESVHILVSEYKKDKLVS